MKQHKVIVEFFIKAKTVSDARMMGIALFDHIQETFNDNNTISKTGYVSVEKVTK